MAINNRKTIIYIEDVEGMLYPQNTLYPKDTLYPNRGTLVIGEYSAPNIIGIASGTLKLDEMLMEDTISFGKCLSDKFEVTLYNCNLDIAKKRISVVQRIGDVEYPVFSGIIDSSTKTDIGGYRDVIAYDLYYTKRDLDVKAWWDSVFSDNTKHTIKYLRESLLDYVDIPFVTSKLINDDIEIGKIVSFDSVTLDTMLSLLCEYSNAIPHMNRNGIMEFIILSDNLKSISNDYETGTSSTFEDYKTNKITGIQLYSDNNTIAQYVGDEANAYIINGNVLMLNMTEKEIDTVLINILNEIKNIEYIPCTIAMLQSDWTLSLGDYIESKVGKHYIMQNSFSGSLLVEQSISCIAKGADLGSTPENSRYSFRVDGKFSEMEKTIDRFRVEVGNSLSGLSSRLELTNSSIELEVKRAKEAEQTISGKLELKIDEDKLVSVLNASADVINITGDRFSLSSTYTNITETGEITCNSLTANNATITGLNASQVVAEGSFTCTGRGVDSDGASYEMVGTFIGGELKITNKTNGAYSFMQGHMIGFQDLETTAKIYMGLTTRDNNRGAYLSMYDEGGRTIVSLNAASWKANFGNVANASTGAGRRYMDVTMHTNLDTGYQFKVTNKEEKHNTSHDISLWGATYIRYSLTVGGTINGTLATDSDENVKTDMKALDIEKSANFIYNLIPSEYKYINGTSNRYHHGFSAQKTKEAMTGDWGLFIDKSINTPNYTSMTQDDSTGEVTEELTARYALRYEELTADIVATCQSLNNRLQEIERKLSV